MPPSDLDYGFWLECTVWAIIIFCVVLAIPSSWLEPDKYKDKRDD